MPRKTNKKAHIARVLIRASMRPRPDAAENKPRECPSSCDQRCFNEAAARCRGKLALQPAQPFVDAVASMRPRPDAAENAPALRRLRGAGSLELQ